VARWEYDKNPQQFCDAIFELERQGMEFRLSVLGQTSPEVPACFENLRSGLNDRIDHWGFLDQRSDYQQMLQQADLVISTAWHEFFGISILEAVDAGCIPILPDRLAYPEIFSAVPECFYDGSTESLVSKIIQFSESLQADSLDTDLRPQLQRIAAQFHWPVHVKQMDQRVEHCRRRSDFS
jgi:glycosyltransferase involved in cell wall biosynthesis